MNHSGFKGLKVASAVGSRIQGDAWGFHWSKKRPAGVGYAGLWGLPNRGLYLRSRGSHWKVFIRTYVLGERAGRHLIRPALLGLCHAEEEGIGRGQRASREPCQEASAVAQETDDGGSV